MSADQPSGWGDIQAVLLIILSVSLLIGTVFFVFYLRYLLDLKKANARSCAKQMVELEALWLLSKEAEQTLVLLERDTHPSNWQDVKTDFHSAWVRLMDVESMLCFLDEKKMKSLFLARKVQQTLEFSEKHLQEYRTLITMILCRPERMSRAKFRSRYLHEMLSAQLDSTSRIVAHPDVTEKTNFMFTRMNEQFTELSVTMTCADHAAIDWLYLREQFTALSREMEVLQREIERDKDAATRARIDGPKLLAKFPGLLEDMESHIGDSVTRKRVFDEVRDMYLDARTYVNQKGQTDWVVVFPMLTTAYAIAMSMKSSSSDDAMEVSE